MKRRDFLIGAGSIGILSLVTSTSKTLAGIGVVTPDAGGNAPQFEKIMNLARKKNQTDMPIGELITFIGKQFLDSPYVPGTLEGDGPEQCRVDLNGLDCFTFMEYSLCLARIIKKEKYSYKDFVDELTFVRYRNGELDGYPSRLHYTSDWLYDNEQKHVLEDITLKSGGVPHKLVVYFMTAHPQFYEQLKDNPDFINKMSKIEYAINQRKYFYIPSAKIRNSEQEFRDGDIVAFTTGKEGLDYSHVGLVCLVSGVPHLLHASSKQKEVVLDKPLDAYIAAVKSDTGISIARPLEISK